METQIIFIDKSTSLYYDTVGGDIVSISASIKALLNLRGLKQADLMEVLKVGSKQALSNKFVGGRWSAADLVAVADACGAKLAFILPDGERVLISAADPVQASPAAAAADPVQASAGAGLGSPGGGCSDRGRGAGYPHKHPLSQKALSRPEQWDRVKPAVTACPL